MNHSDDLVINSHAEVSDSLPVRGHRRSESEASTVLSLTRTPVAGRDTSDFADDSPHWKSRSGRGGQGKTLFKQRSSAGSGLLVSSARRRIGSHPSPTHRHSGSQGSRQGRYGGRRHDSNASTEEDDGIPKLVSLSDLIRKEDHVPATLLYEHSRDVDAEMDAWDTAGGDPQQAINSGTVGTQDALQAAEHGNSLRLSKFLQDGGDPATVSRLHHNRLSLLHLAAGSATMGGRLSFISHRSRPEPECKDGYASCVSELLAAGADPNVTSVQGFTPLMGAALTGSKECCWMLLRAGAQVDRTCEDGRTAHDFARKAKPVGGSSGDQSSPVLAVLRDPPKKVPRAPTFVRATLAELSCLEPEDAVHSAQVRWRVPSQSSLAPTQCGDVERYYVKCWCRGKGKEAIKTKTSTVDVPRRDFCRNQIIDRGIALRKNLHLPQSRSASTVVHGLQVGETYSFTVSCIAEVEGSLRHSPPSCMSRSLLIPESKEDHQWRLGGMLSMVTGKDQPSPSAAGESNTTQAQARRAVDPPPTSSTTKQTKNLNVTWAEDDLNNSMNLRKSNSHPAGHNVRGSPSTGSLGRTLPVSSREWAQAIGTSPTPPARRFSQSNVDASAPRPPSRSSWGGQTFSPPMLSPTLARGTNARRDYRNTTAGASQSSRITREKGVQALAASGDRSSRRYRTYDQSDSFQDEGCSLS